VVQTTDVNCSYARTALLQLLQGQHEAYVTASTSDIITRGTSWAD
jgi:hypothetical protein